MHIPKPSEVPAAKVNPAVPEPKPVKKPFVRKEHLTSRPMRNDPGLVALKASFANRKK